MTKKPKTAKTREKKKVRRPIVMIDLQGGVVHSIQASEELSSALFVFSGDGEDCRGEKLVTLNPEFPDFIYAVQNVAASLTDDEEKFITKKAKEYAGSL
jgi:hypothetical protein